ncbi:ATP-binding domain-containing protein, partial [Verrucomicrobiales bacterium]|nr:ATP-binding domain-containing protein [Verrucomicrobiales bacterium]
IPNKFKFDPICEIQVLAPMNVNSLGTKNLNVQLQEVLNPAAEFKREIERFGVTFRKGDKVIQTRNNYDHEVFNGDIGVVDDITTDPTRVVVKYDANREVEYEPGELDELQLAYAITIHKSQGSEFPAVVIPVSTQQFVLLQKNLIYTGLTRGKKLVIIVGEKRALAMAVNNVESAARWSGLKWRLEAGTSE